MRTKLVHGRQAVLNSPAMEMSALFTPMFYAVALSLCMVWVVVSDVWHYIIPNSLNVLIIVLYASAALVLPIQDWLPALGMAGLMLVLGLGLFTLGLMGGGDIKLLVVLTLWTGWHIATARFIFLTAIAGGVLVFVVLVLRVILPPIWLKLRPTKNLPRILTKKQPVPYGIAIAFAFAWLLWTDDVAGIASAS